MGVTEAIRKMPEFQACVPIFEANIRYLSQRFDFSGGSGGLTIEGEFSGIFDPLQRMLPEYPPGTMYPSAIYGTYDAAHALTALARRLGYDASAEQVHGDNNPQWALVVRGLRLVV